MNWPKLSETLPHPRDFGICQACGGTEIDLDRWVECDDADVATATVVNLCRPCADKIIEPHPRLYSVAHAYQPIPGSMPKLCSYCPYREGLDCKHPDAKANGGPGLQIKFPEPRIAMVDGVTNGKRWGRSVTVYMGNPTWCAGRVVQGEGA